MATSFSDSSFSGLLCVEDNNSVFLFDDSENPRAVDSSSATWHIEDRGFGDSGEGKGVLPEMLLGVEELSVLLEKESQYMPERDYWNRLRSGDLGIGARKEAIDWIKKVGVGAINFSFRLLLVCGYLTMVILRLVGLVLFIWVT